MRDGSVLAMYCLRKMVIPFGTKHVGATLAGSLAGDIAQSAATGTLTATGAGGVIGGVGAFMAYPVYRIIGLCTQDDNETTNSWTYKSPKAAAYADVLNTVNVAMTTAAVWGSACLFGFVSAPAALTVGGGTALVFGACQLENYLIRTHEDQRELTAFLTATFKVVLVSGLIFAAVSLGVLTPPVGLCLAIIGACLAIRHTLSVEEYYREHQGHIYTLNSDKIRMY